MQYVPPEVVLRMLALGELLGEVFQLSGGEKAGVKDSVHATYLHAEHLVVYAGGWRSFPSPPPPPAELSQHSIASAARSHEMDTEALFLSLPFFCTTPGGFSSKTCVTMTPI